MTISPDGSSASGSQRRPRLPASYWRLWAATALSGLGSQLQSIAIPLWVLHTTGSPVATGLAFAVESLPAVLLAPWVGYLADRYDRRRLVVACEALSASTVLLLLVATDQRALPLVYVTVTLVRVFHAVSTPAAQAILRGTVPEAALPAASNRFETMFGAIVTIGPIAGSALFAWTGIASVLLVNLFSFVAGALLAATLPTCPGEAGLKGARHATADAARTVLRSPVLAGVSLAEAGYFLCFGGSTAVCVMLVQQGLGERLAGLYPTGVGLGWLVTSAVVMRRYADRAVRLVTVAAAACAPLALLLAAGVGRVTVVCVLGGVLSGAVNVLVAGGATIVYQTGTDPGRIGRVFALRRAVVNACLGTSSVGVPLLGTAVGLAPAVAVQGAVTSLFMLGTLTWTVRGAGRARTAAPRRAPAGSPAVPGEAARVRSGRGDDG